MILKMKYIVPILIVLFAVAGCNKDNFVDNEQQVGSSKVTYFAEITIKGDEYLSLVKGDSYTDAGATATEKGQSITVSASGTVKTNEPGLYTITYSAINKDGFAAKKTRTVAVLSAPELPGTDISGEYKHVGGTYVSTVTKLAPGLYSTDNCWSSATTIPCLFITVDGVTISVPEQPSAFGDLFGTGTLSATGLLQYKISIPAQGINNSTRNWQKQ